MKSIIEKIEVGTQFWDGRYGPFVCTQKPEFQKVNDGQDEGYFWLGKDSHGSMCEFLWIEKYSHYGPKVYLEQAYFSHELTKDLDPLAKNEYTCILADTEVEIKDNQTRIEQMLNDPWFN